jgi:hypothetical protein
VFVVHQVFPLLQKRLLWNHRFDFNQSSFPTWFHFNLLHCRWCLVWIHLCTAIGMCDTQSSCASKSWVRTFVVYRLLSHLISFDSLFTLDVARFEFESCQRPFVDHLFILDLSWFHFIRFASLSMMFGLKSHLSWLKFGFCRWSWTAVGMCNVLSSCASKSCVRTFAVHLLTSFHSTFFTVHAARFEFESFESQVFLPKAFASRSQVRPFVGQLLKFHFIRFSPLSMMFGLNSPCWSLLTWLDFRCSWSFRTAIGMWDALSSCASKSYVRTVVVHLLVSSLFSSIFSTVDDVWFWSHLLTWLDVRCSWSCRTAIGMCHHLSSFVSNSFVWKLVGRRSWLSMIFVLNSTVDWIDSQVVDCGPTQEHLVRAMLYLVLLRNPMFEIWWFIFLFNQESVKRWPIG